MLELGKAGTAGAGKGEVPVLRDDELVGRLRSTDFWKEGSVAVVGDREWVLERRKGGALVGRHAVDPEDAGRFRAEQVSVWKGTYRFTVGERTVAESGSTGGWSPRPTLTAGEELPLDAQVFLLWLVLVVQRRTYGAAIAVSLGAATAGSS